PRGGLRVSRRVHRQDPGVISPRDSCKSATRRGYRWTNLHPGSPRSRSPPPKYVGGLFHSRSAGYADGARSRSEGFGLPIDVRGSSRFGRIASSEYAPVQHVWLPDNLNTLRDDPRRPTDWTTDIGPAVGRAARIGTGASVSGGDGLAYTPT